MKKIFIKFRYYLALLFIISTITNLTVLPTQYVSCDKAIITASSNDPWIAETK